jgi:N-acetylglutamate synthase-like GNAT family acetyltransferase
MTYRKATKSDIPQIKELCDKYNIPFPASNLETLVAEHDGKIIALVGIKIEYHITPLIAENPIAGTRLWHMLEGIIVQTGIQEVRALVSEDNKKHQGHLIKDGFAQTGTGKLIFVKEY